MPSNIIKTHGNKYNHNPSLFNNRNDKPPHLHQGSSKTVRLNDRLNRKFKLLQKTEGIIDFDFIESLIKA